MSPASLRRYRAERLLRDEFRSLRSGVMASVCARLRGYGAELDHGELEACYAAAWQGLYAVTLGGEEVLDPAAWLAVATFRRAIDEHRAARRRQSLAAAHVVRVGSLRAGTCEEPCHEADPAGELDQRVKLGQLFEALRLRLSTRERRAFTLCYLQGLSRAEAATAMGLSERRMRKLMDGRGGGHAGTTAKVSALVHTIRAEKWCEEQGSLMRGFAYGVLDPQGERHRLAVMHTRACPACRSYVASLRGLAALLPPAPGMLALLAGAGSAARDTTRHAAAGVHAAARAHARPSGGLTGPATAAAGTTGAGAAGGGWLVIGGGAGAKLAATCLLALGVGAGCAVLTVPGSSSRGHPASHLRVAAARASERAAVAGPDPGAQIAAASTAAAIARGAGPQSVLTPATRASREFGPEHAGLAEVSEPSRSARSNAPLASTAAAREFAGAERSSSSASGSAPATNSVAAAATARGESAPPAAAATGEGGPAQAQREFSPG